MFGYNVAEHFLYKYRIKTIVHRVRFSRSTRWVPRFNLIEIIGLHLSPINRFHEMSLRLLGDHTAIISCMYKMWIVSNHLSQILFLMSMRLHPDHRQGMVFFGWLCLRQDKYSIKQITQYNNINEIIFWYPPQCFRYQKFEQNNSVFLL